MAHKSFHFSVIVIIFSLFADVGFSELSFAENSIESPRKQLEKGINFKDVLCKPEYVLTILQSDKLTCLSKEPLS